MIILFILLVKLELDILISSRVLYRSISLVFESGIAAKNNIKKILYASSSSVYGNSNSFIKSKNKSINIYAVSK